MKSIYYALFVLLCSCGQEIPDYNNLGAGFYLDQSDRMELELHYPDSVKSLVYPVHNIKKNIHIITLCIANSGRFQDSTFYRLYHSAENISKYYDSIPNLKNLSNPEVFYNYYFIIYKYPVKVYGPYIRSEYLKAMKILNVPDSLRVDK